MVQVLMTTAADDANETANNNGQNLAVEKPRKRRGGPPKGTRNHLRHGLTATALPPGCTGIRKSITQFRQSLEKIILANRDEIGVYDASLVNEACRWEQHSLLATRWLRLHADSMDHAGRLAYSREVARGASERSKALKELKIDGRRLSEASDPPKSQIPTFNEMLAAAFGDDGQPFTPPADSGPPAVDGTAAAGTAYPPASLTASPVGP